MYREIAPIPALAPWVETYWTRDAIASAGEVSHRVLPDGCADIVFLEDEAFAVGAMTTPLVLTGSEFPKMFGIRFRPGCARSFLGVPLAEITDLRVPLRDLWRRAPDPRSIETALLARAERPHPRVEEAIERLGRGGSVDRVARELGVTRQHLRRELLEHVGVGPKTFARVARFRRLLASARHGVRADWAGMAVDLGYTDQSHLIADFREFAGTTPVPFFLSL